MFTAKIPHFALQDLFLHVLWILSHLWYTRTIGGTVLWISTTLGSEKRT